MDRTEDGQLSRFHTAHLVADPGEVARYQRMLTPWADGEMGQVIRIRSAVVTGFGRRAG